MIMHAISTDDGWHTIYKDGLHIYSGHGGSYRPQAMALTGAVVHQAGITGSDPDYTIDNLCDSPAASLAESPLVWVF